MALDAFCGGYPESFERVKRECANVPHLSERMVIDLVNGLEVSEDLIRFRKSRTSLKARLWDSITGEGLRRDTLTQEQHQRSLEGLTTAMMVFVDSQTLTMKTLLRLDNRLSAITAAVTSIESLALQNRAGINRLAQSMKETARRINNRLDSLDQQIKSVDAAQRSHTRIEFIMSEWRSGAIFQGYPPLVQACFAMDGIASSDVGKFVFTNTELTLLVRSRVLLTLSDRFGITRQELFHIPQLLRSLADQVDDSRAMYLEFLLGHDQKTWHGLLGKTVDENLALSGYQSLVDSEEIYRFYTAERIIDNLNQENVASAQEEAAS